MTVTLDINKLKTFYYVALEGSYPKASLQLGIKPSYISKQIKYLEEYFQVKLFKRTKRSLVLTTPGEKILKSTRSIIDQVNELQELSSYKDQEDNTLRIVTTNGYTTLWLIKKLSKFNKIYPEIKFRIVTTDEYVDLTNSLADVAILPKIEINPNIKTRKLFNVRSKLFASRKYINEYGMPKNIAELKEHKLISFYHNEVSSRGNVDWHLRIAGDKQIIAPIMVINSAIGQVEAAVNNFGILAIPEKYPYIKIGKLVNILSSEFVEIPVYFATSLQKAHLKKVVCLERFLFKEMQQES